MAVTITSPVAYQVFQRTRGATTGSMLITGTYSGLAVDIQAQIVEDTSGTVIVAWTTIASSLAGGTYSGTLTGIPQTTNGKWYNVQVRSQLAGGATLDSLNATFKTGIGIVLIIAGQSNAVGFADDTPTTCVDLGAFFNGTTWAHLVDPIGGQGNSVGPNLVNALVTLYNIPIGICMKAQGSTSLYSSWQRNSSNHTDPATLYGQMITLTVTVGGVEGIVWIQGETDAGDHRTEAQYASDLTTFISNTRSDMGYTVPFMLNQLGNALGGSSATEAEWHGIQNAQLTRDNGTDILAITAHDFALRANDVHFLTANGFTKMGPRFAQALQFYLGNIAYYRGPAVATVFYASPAKASLYVLMTQRGGTDFTPTSSITGFVVLDGASTMTISSVIRISNTVIKITLSAAIVGTGTLRYLYGKNPPVTGLVVDNTANALPMESPGADVNVGAALIQGTWPGGIF